MRVCRSLSILLLLCASLVWYVSCETYYISNQHPANCPERIPQDHCLSLVGLLRYTLASNTTVELESGTHYLNGHLSFSNLDYFSMLAENGTIICENNDLHYKDGFSFNRIEHLHIAGINFSVCRIGASRSATFLLTDSIIEQYGGRVKLSQVQNATIVRSTFANNCCNNMLEATFTSLFVKSCTFARSSVGNGIRLWGAGLEIEQSTFTHMYRGILVSWGSLFASRSTFVANLRHAITGSDATNITIDKCTFLRNVYRYSRDNGSAVSSESTSWLAITNSEFISNTADYYGGAVYVNGPLRTVVISNSTFSNNNARQHDGGAIYLLTSESSVNIMNNTFTGNSANGGSGGAIHLSGSNSDILFEGNIFDSNSAAQCGVLRTNELSNLSIIASTFSHNTAVGSGDTDSLGGVTCVRYSSIFASSSIFEGNTAMEGDAGVIFADESEIEIVESIFRNNLAGRDGGTIFVQGTRSQVSVTESSFTYNHAMDRGGAIATNGSALEFYPTDIYDNTAEFGGVISACDSDITVSNDSDISATNDCDLDCVYYDQVESFGNQTTVMCIQSVTTTAKSTTEVVTTALNPVEVSTGTLSETTTIDTKATTEQSSSQPVTITTNMAGDTTGSTTITEPSTSRSPVTLGTTTGTETGTTTKSNTSESTSPLTSSPTGSSNTSTEESTSQSEIPIASTSTGAVTELTPPASSTADETTETREESTTTSVTTTDLPFPHIESSTAAPSTTKESTLTTEATETEPASNEVSTTASTGTPSESELTTSVGETMAFPTQTTSTISSATTSTAEGASTGSSMETTATTSVPTGSEATEAHSEGTESSHTSTISVSETDAITTRTTVESSTPEVVTESQKGTKPQMKTIIIISVTISMAIIIAILVALGIVLLLYYLFKRNKTRIWWPLNNSSSSQSYDPLISGEMESVGGQSQLEELSEQQDTVHRDENVF